MSYQKVNRILSRRLLEQIQEYVGGASIYIPKTAGYKKCWGEGTSTRQELRLRNQQAYSNYLSGRSTGELSSLHCLSLKSIQRIIGQEKKNKQSKETRTHANLPHLSGLFDPICISQLYLSNKN